LNASAFLFMKNFATERLILRLYAEKDKTDFLELFADKAVMKHVDKGVLARKQAENLWQKLFDEFYSKGLTGLWAVFAKDNRRFVGHATFRPRPEIKDDWEIGYILKQAEWQKGFATEIAAKLIELGFGKLNLPEIFATVDDDNFASIRVLEKAGMSFKRYEFDEQGRFSVYSIRRIERQ